MNFKKVFLFLLFISLLMNACGDDEFVPIPCTNPIDTTVVVPELNILWQVPLNPVDTGYYFSFDPLIYKGNVLFSLLLYQSWDILYMRDGKTGELVWDWEDSSTTGYSTGVGKSRYNSNLCYTNWGKNYLLDLNIGQTIWDYEDIECGSPRITRIGDYFYTTHQPCGGTPSSITLVRTDLKKSYPSWDSVYTIYASEGYTPSIEMPALWVDSSGDSILYFQNRQVSFQTLDDKIDLYAYNLSQDSLLWRRDSITPSGNSSVQPPLIYEDKVYFTGAQVILCFDALSGDLIWENHLGQGNLEHFLTSNMLIEEGILVVKNDNKFIHGLDPATGTEIWRQAETGSANTSIVYYDGHVYFTGGRYLFKVAVQTGEVKWKFKSPNKAKGYSKAVFWYTGVAVDPELKHLYTSDGHFIMCIDLEE